MIKHFISIVLLSALAACGGGGDNTTSTDPVVSAQPSPVIDKKNIPTEFKFSKQDAWIVVNFSMDKVQSIIVNNLPQRGTFSSPEGPKFPMGMFTVGKNQLTIQTAEADYVGDIVFSESDLTGIVTRPWDGGGFYSDKYFAVVANHPNQGIQVAVSIDGGAFIQSDEPRCLQLSPAVYCTTDFGYVTVHPKLTAGEHSVTAKMTTTTGNVFFAQPLRFTVPN